jgi:hypothetical protein
MYAKLLAFLALIGLTASGVTATPVPAGQANIDRRTQPWKEWKREAVQAETPEIIADEARADDKTGGGRAG